MATPKPAPNPSTPRASPPQATAPAPSRTVAIADVHYVPGFLTAEEIDEVCAAVSERPLYSATIVGLPDDPVAVVRHGAVAAFPTERFPEVASRLADVTAELNAAHWRLDVAPGVTDLEYAEYAPTPEGPGFFDWHFDLTDARAAPLSRKLSFECGLGGGHRGGERLLRNGPTEYKVKVLPGDLVVFPSFVLQSVAPVREGVRRSLVGWVDGPRLR